MDFIQPFLVSTGGIDIQGRLIRLEGALDRILTQHQYPEPISFLLADFIILTVALGCGVKSDGKISAHIKGIGGPVSLMAVDFFTDGSLRGYAQFDSEKISALQKDGEPMDVFSLFRKGHLVFTVDQKGSKEQYQEIVMLHGATLVETLLHYFEQTHQFDVALKAMTGHHSKWRSGCLFLQKLSNDEITEFLDESENGWDQATARVGAISDESLLNFDPKPQEYLREFFPDEKIEMLDKLKIKAHCRCNRPGVVSVLRSFPKEDLQGMKEGKHIVVTCKFCDKRYELSEEEFRLEVVSNDQESKS